MPVIGSIVVPAHNEAGAIRVLLAGFRGAMHDGRYEAVVVSNGSSDDTASVARRLLADATEASVLELEHPSKIAALRCGDDTATVFPRAYIDADVSIDEDTLVDLFECLRARADPVVAAPTVRIDTEGTSRLVRSYFRAWTRLPYLRDGVVGVGVYALNQAGKDLVGPFPDVLNDDEWVRRHFPPAQQLISRGAFVIRAPHTATALVRQRARVLVGNAELAGAATVGAEVNTRATSIGDLITGVRRREIMPADALVYVMFVLAIRGMAAWRRSRGTARKWSTDLTSRA